MFQLGDTAAKGALPQDSSMRNEKSTKLRAQSLRVDSRDTIPYGSGKLLWLTVDSEVPADTVCLIEPLEENEELDASHCFVRRSVVRVQNVNGEVKVPVHVDNFGVEDKELHKGILVATVSAFEEEDFIWTDNTDGQKPDAYKTALRQKIEYLKGKDGDTIETVFL